MKKVKVEHEELDSRMATAVALFNEWIKWCEANDIPPRKISVITSLFELTKEEYEAKHKKDEDKWQ